MGITRWAQVNYKQRLFALVGIALGWGLIYSPTHAAVRVYLDQPTLERGYTVELPSGRFSLGIPAGTFSEPIKVALKRPAVEEQARLLESAPTEWTLEGKVRTYNLTSESTQSIQHPIWVSLNIPIAEHTHYFLTYLDEGKGEWVVVPSSVDTNLKKITGALPFSYATLAAFSTPLTGPTENIDFQTVDSTLGSLQAASAIVLDVESGQVLYEKNADEVRSIASMTKVATAWVALTLADDWSQTVNYSNDWSREGAALRIEDGETISIQDLLYTTVVGSANNTAVGLANAFTDQETFVANMNDWVSSMGLTATQFVEPSGLDARNVSTAREYALLSREVFRSFDMLQLSTTKTYTLHLPQTGEHTIHTTDNLLYSDLYLTGGKTGYTEEAGYCLMIQAKNDQDGQVIVVVMGEPSSSDRFTETYALTQWAFDNYSWN